MNARFWLGIGIALGAAGPQLALEAQIIDVHVHAFGFDEYGIPAPPNEITGAIPSFDSDDAAMQGAFDAMRRAGIVRAVTSGPLRHVSRWHAANAAIIGGAYTGPRDALPSVDELRDLFATGQIAVLGELGLQYRGVEPGAPELEEYWALAAELDVPVGIHTGLGDAGTPYGCCPEWRDAFELAVQGVESAAFLSAEQKRAIFYDNAARFLRLTPDQITADRAAAR